MAQQELTSSYSQGPFTVPKWQKISLMPWPSASIHLSPTPSCPSAFSRISYLRKHIHLIIIIILSFGNIISLYFQIIIRLKKIIIKNTVYHEFNFFNETFVNLNITQKENEISNLTLYLHYTENLYLEKKSFKTNFKHASKTGVLLIHIPDCYQTHDNVLYPSNLELGDPQYQGTGKQQHYVAVESVLEDKGMLNVTQPHRQCKELKAKARGSKGIREEKVTENFTQVQNTIKLICHQKEGYSNAVVHISISYLFSLKKSRQNKS